MEDVDPDILAIAAIVRTLAKRVAALDGTSLASIRDEAVRAATGTEIPYMQSVAAMRAQAEAVGAISALLDEAICRRRS